MLSRAFKTVMNGISMLTTFWWAGVVYMVAGIDITDPDERQKPSASVQSVSIKKRRSASSSQL